MSVNYLKFVVSFFVRNGSDNVIDDDDNKAGGGNSSVTETFWMCPIPHQTCTFSMKRFALSMS